MEKRHQGQHGDDCFGCRIQNINVSPAAMPSRYNKNPPKIVPHNSWENAIPTDSRNMPFLGRDLEPISQKRYVENRHRIEQARRDPSSVKD